jgi:hypothetical protein
VVHASAGRGMIGPHSKGRPDPRHASRRDAPLGRSAEHVAHAAFSLQRNSVFVFHIAWSITASLRATATRAFLNPQRFASRRPHAFSREKRTGAQPRNSSSLEVTLPQALQHLTLVLPSSPCPLTPGVRAILFGRPRALRAGEIEDRPGDRAGVLAVPEVLGRGGARPRIVVNRAAA